MAQVVSEKTYVRFVAEEFEGFIRANISTLSDKNFRILSTVEHVGNNGLEYVTFEIKILDVEDA